LEDESLCIEIFDQTVQIFKETSLSWMSEVPWVTSFDISRLHDGVSHSRCNPQVGYVTIAAVPSSEGGSTVRVFNRNATTPLHKRVQPKETYLLVGGLGGLGRSIARHLVANGARHLAFISRSGCSSLESQHFLAELVHDQGVDARVYPVDACDLEALTTAIQSTIASEMPRICGVFHCAAVVKDAVFENMTFDRWVACFKPKAVASWNIVQAIESTDQDPFYVFLASSAGVIGTRGQANYAAGNVFLDALARSLRIKGRRAVSVDLGPILGAGMLTEDEAILDILRASGFYGIRHQDFLKVMKHAITMETFRDQPLPPQVVLGVGTGGLMAQNEPADPYWSRTALYSFLNIVDAPRPDLSASSLKGKNTDVKAQLMQCTDVTAATNIVCLGLANMLAKSMNMLPEEIDVMRPANAYGVDSLVAVGVRNWVLGHCNVHVSVFEVMSDMTILALAKSVVEKGQIGKTSL
jgi:NAD(P)-dependent dehydrogenase (short-subunit alcohol dehydrogenase family)